MQVIPGVVRERSLDLYRQHSATLRHVLITELWLRRAELGEVETSAGAVRRYQALPISDAGFALYREHGYQELLSRLALALGFRPTFSGVVVGAALSDYLRIQRPTNPGV